MRWSSVFLGVGSFVLLCGFLGVSQAQDRRGDFGDRFRQGFQSFSGRGGQGGNVMGLLQNDKVRKELKITEDEEAFLQLIEEDTRNKLREFFSKMRDQPREEGRESFRKMGERMREQAEEVQEQVVEIIGKERFERLKQIQVQLAGVAALMNPKTAEELDITEEQREQLRDAAREVEQELRKIRNEKLEERVMEIFDKKQKKKWDKMKGEPIDFAISPPQGGFRGRPEGDRRPGGFRGRPGDGDGRSRRSSSRDRRPASD